MSESREIPRPYLTFSKSDSFVPRNSPFVAPTERSSHQRVIARLAAPSRATVRRCAPSRRPIPPRRRRQAAPCPRRRSLAACARLSRRCVRRSALLAVRKRFSSARHADREALTPHPALGAQVVHDTSPPTKPLQMWTLLENARPPYNQSVFLTPGAVPCREEKSGRVNKAGRGTCSRDVSWRLVWAESAAAAQPAFSGAELCGLLPSGAQVLSVGDSISEQLLSSWRARLYTSGIDHRRPGMARWTVCGSPLRRFYHLEVWAWALSGPRFRASDSRAEVCAEQLRQNPAKFGLHMVSEHDLELKLSNATEVVFSTSAVALRTRKPSSQLPQLRHATIPWQLRPSLGRLVRGGEVLRSKHNRAYARFGAPPGDPRCPLVLARAGGRDRSCARAGPRPQAPALVPHLGAGQRAMVKGHQQADACEVGGGVSELRRRRRGGRRRGRRVPARALFGDQRYERRSACRASNPLARAGRLRIVALRQPMPCRRRPSARLAAASSIRSACWARASMPTPPPSRHMARATRCTIACQARKITPSTI